MHKHSFLTLTILFLALSNINAQEVNKKKPLWAIPIDFSWGGTHGIILSTGISAGFQISKRVLIGPEVGLSFNGTAYQNVNFGIFTRLYFTEESNSFFTELKYLHGISRRNIIVNGRPIEQTDYDNLSRTYLGCGFKYDNKKDKRREILLGIENDNKSTLITIAEYKIGFRWYLQGKSE